MSPAVEADAATRLAVLLGNTTCRIAVMAGLSCEDELVFSHDELRAGDSPERLRAFCRGREVGQSGLCSVVPPNEAQVRHLFESAGLRPPETVRPTASEFFPTRYRSMDTLGADRYCGVLAARMAYGAPAIVVDCGTATTVNVIEADGCFLGGVIAPGVETALRALHERTAQLPAVDLSKNVPLIGADTEESMRAGAVHFSRFAVEGLVAGMKMLIGESTPLILTGGNAPVLLAAGLVCDPMIHDEKLLFRGVVFHLLFTT